MTKKFNAWARVLGVLACLSPGVSDVEAYAFLGGKPVGEANKWPAGNVNYLTDFPPFPGGKLEDGAPSFHSVFSDCDAAWDVLIYPLNLISTATPGVSKTLGNGINACWFDSTIAGKSFDGALAVAYTVRATRSGEPVIIEGKIIFNTAYSFDSYRGNYRSNPIDFKRVALHELGHTLGFDHPDDYNQKVDAIMNSTASNLDDLQADEVAGARALYGGGSGPGVASDGSGPKRGPKGLGDLSVSSGGGHGAVQITKTPEDEEALKAPVKAPFSIVLDGDLEQKFLINVEKPLYSLTGRVAGDVKTRFLQYSLDGGRTWQFLSGYNPVDKTFNFYSGMPSKGKSQIVLIRAVGDDEYSAVRTVVFHRE